MRIAAGVLLVGLALAPGARAHDGSRAYDIIHTGLRYVGAPYKFGASMSEAPARFDCSSFTKYVFAKHGIYLPRSAYQQSQVGGRVSFEGLRPGDLMFFKCTSRDVPIDHVAIYIGNGRMLHATPSRGVNVQSVSSFWRRTFRFGRRVIR